MRLSWKYLGKLIRDLRLERDISQQEVVDALPLRYSIRSLGRVESGQRRPERSTLIAILTSGLKLTEVKTINPVLRAAKYVALTAQETRRFQLTTSSPASNIPTMTSREPQKTTWGPTDGKPPGISVDGSAGSDFVPWRELEPEIKARLLTQLGLNIPPNCGVVLGEFRGRRNWLIRIVDSEGNRRGYVWFGTDPDNNWAYDGFVRAGDDSYVVWQVFQRYSDGTYRRIRVQQPRSAASADQLNEKR